MHGRLLSAVLLALFSLGLGASAHASPFKYARRRAVSEVGAARRNLASIAGRGDVSASALFASQLRLTVALERAHLTRAEHFEIAKKTRMTNAQIAASRAEK